MAAEDIVRSMRTRVPWTVAGQILGSLGLEKSMGWRRTLAKVEAGELDYNDAEARLGDALEEHLLAGEKLVRFFRVAPGAMAGLRQAIGQVEVPENEFSSAFPALLEPANLWQFRGHPPYVAANVQFVSGIALALASARFLLSREAVIPAELPEAAAAELGGYEQIICVGHQRLEAIDALWVPAEGNIIEIRVDFPLGTHIRAGLAAADQAVARFSELLGGEWFDDQVNLFPAIQGLYDAQNEGRMVELGFMVSGSSQKLEKTRRDLECCRLEAYHLGGVGALAAPIAPYRTSVLWQFPLDEDLASEPEITLRGVSAQTADPNAFLGEMVVRNCTGLDDYDHVRDRVLGTLPL